MSKPFKPEDPRKPHNAYAVLPEALANEIAEHVKCCTIYCPASKPMTPEERKERAEKIRREYRTLVMSNTGRKRRAPIKILSERFGISRRSVHKILNDPRALLK